MESKNKSLSTILDTSSLFSKNIQKETVPSKFKVPTLSPYDRLGDPKEHIIIYNTMI
ncbi:conserved hypothetical protein [Ricinus communis]|uniref:Uncharacterized protein n=1 Tax=Ricinus communis TaxID=3988 RepID=B9RPI5_RICCO|nr:conserved hypothetical protein [Ricinus communis]